MRAKELHAKNQAELEKHVLKLRDKTASLRREKHLAEPKNAKELKAIRKELARALTILNEKTAKETA